MASFFQYYGKVIAQAFRSGATWGRDQLIGVVITAAILILQIRAGLLVPSQVGVTWTTIALPYGLLFAIFILVQLLRAPWQLDKKKQEEIERLIKNLGDKASRDELARFMQAGRDLCHSAPSRTANDAAVEEWTAKVLALLQHITAYLEARSASALAIFLDDSNVQAADFISVHAKAQRMRLTMDVRLRNLKHLLDNPHHLQ